MIGDNIIRLLTWFQYMNFFGFAKGILTTMMTTIISYLNSTEIEAPAKTAQPQNSDQPSSEEFAIWKALKIRNIINTIMKKKMFSVVLQPCMEVAHLMMNNRSILGAVADKNLRGHIM